MIVISLLHDWIRPGWTLYLAIKDKHEAELRTYQGKKAILETLVVLFLFKVMYCLREWNRVSVVFLLSVCYDLYVCFIGIQCGKNHLYVELRRNVFLSVAKHLLMRFGQFVVPTCWS